jgi:hypothetical protein
MGIKNRIYKTLFPWYYAKKTLAKFSFEKLGNFREEDVFLVGYPKSGNTLLQHILAHLIYKLPVSTPKNMINVAVTEYYNNPYYFRLDQQHYFKSHELPKPHFRKVIYIMRDGRDAVWSYYHMLNNQNRKPSLKKMFENGGDCPFGTWNNHIVSWHENPYNADILFIKFEDLLKDKAVEIRKIADFLNLERSEEDINLVIEATSFESMKELENSFAWSEAKKHNNWKPNTNFVRSGKKNSFKSKEVPDAYVKDFNNISIKALKISNYS